MPSLFAHAISALPLARAGGVREFRKLAAWSAFCAVLPDADVIAFNIGIPYESMWGHRGITHSFFFSALLAASITFTVFRKQPGRKLSIWLCLFLATASHALLDACTNGGLGVAFWAPFSDERFFFTHRPIQVSPIGAGAFFSERGLRVLRSELVWVAMPSLAAYLLVALLRKAFAKGH